MNAINYCGVGYTLRTMAAHLTDVQVQRGVMDNFPDFMKRPENRIATSSQATPGVDGYVFDGADGSQMAFWTCRDSAVSAPHAHDYDEYFVVVQGCYTLIIDGRRIPVRAGNEYSIPKGTWHGGEPVAGTRTIHAFGGRRVERIQPQNNRSSG
ncbi:MAG TPA: cupin domain-containing protein [Candidatus Acidoferrales bacterium]|nr:cupin domain-containing protein [Candidatus Acidoferrales bacterium]